MTTTARFACALLAATMSMGALANVADAKDKPRQGFVVVDEQEGEVIFDDGEDDVICILRQKIVKDPFTGKKKIKTVPVCAEVE